MPNNFSDYLFQLKLQTLNWLGCFVVVRFIGKLLLSFTITSDKEIYKFSVKWNKMRFNFLSVEFNFEFFIWGFIVIKLLQT